MKIIKLDAIDSTNSFLKEMAQKMPLDNYTVVRTSSQTKGRGQMKSQWISEPDKNLLCSVFITFDELLTGDQLDLNYAVSLAVFNTLKQYNVPKLKIKWPNDIMSDAKKITGILVENVMHGRRIKSTIIGIGINVNQMVFPENIPNATSIKIQIGKDLALDDLLRILITEIKKQVQLVGTSKGAVLKKQYIDLMYKKSIPSMYKNSKGVLFMGVILGVSTTGKLQIQLEDESVKEFGIKKVSFL